MLNFIEILQYHNLDLENIVSPVNPDKLEQLLITAGYNSSKENNLPDQWVQKWF